MILHEQQQVPIAEADWTDDGVVALLTFPTLEGHTTRMAPDTARALARQLNTAAAEAEGAVGEVAAQRAHRAVQHGFDIDTQDQAESALRASGAIR
ncbi:hypothetical protein ACIPVB_09035 [Microbacterium sp. NPDC090007]|uniref:hypothetical protein n=1 Tax=Microbacterium sp. NPDC090007 TaxID=3364204 RepID=UPI00380160E8